MPRPMRACERCEKAFRPQRATARFCSPTCRKDAWLANGGGAGTQNAKDVPMERRGTLSAADAPAATPDAPLWTAPRDAHGFLHRTPSQRRVRVEP
jgi:hypothetical protein